MYEPNLELKVAFKGVFFPLQEEDKFQSYTLWSTFKQNLNP